ncbi:MAG: N-acyl homoserine lactonase family protein [Chloroflexi bacterium]|nr:N-acyl homoserine lactonase family protein [Chloroflexota bacterium]
MTTDPQVVALPMGDLTFPADGAIFPGQTVVVVAYAVRHAGGVFLFDTGFREAAPGDDPELREYFQKYALRTRSLPDVLAAAGVDLGEITAVANCHLHFDHSGQNALFPGVPIYVQPAELAAVREPDYTLPEVYDFEGARFEQVAGDHEVAPGIRIFATPGHSPGHQSLVVETPDGPVLLAGQAVYTRGEWAGIPGALVGSSDTRPGADQAGYARSVARLKALNPRRVLFGHDRQGWPD